jgi:hypothetical protein
MIEVCEVTKRFGTTEVLKAMSFSVARGEVVSPDRPFGIGKVNHAALHQRAREARRRHDHGGRQAGRRSVRHGTPDPHRCGYGVPAIQPLPA